MVIPRLAGNIGKISESWRLFAAIALIFGTIYSLITPPLWGIDETSHFARVYQIAKGEVIPNMEVHSYGGELPVNLIDLSNYTKNDLLDNSGGGILSRKDVTNSNGYIQFIDAKFSSNHRTYLWTASYSPVAYPGATLGVVVAGLFDATIGQTILLARFFSLILYIVIICLSLWILREYKLKWVIFSVALLPISLFQASVVTADNIAIALSTLFCAILIRIFIQSKSVINRKLLFGLIFIAILLPLIKINYIFISLLLMILPNTIYRTKKLTIGIKIAAVIITSLLAMVWSAVVKVTANAPVSQRPDGRTVVPGDQIAWILENPLHFVIVLGRTLVVNADSYLYSITTLVGWNFVTTPIVFVLILGGGLSLAILYAKDDLAFLRGRIIIVSLLVLGGLASIFGALYIAFNPTGSRLVEGVQGRYFLPLLIPSMLLIGYITPIRIKLKDKLAPYIFGTISSICLFVSVTYYYFANY